MINNTLIWQRRSLQWGCIAILVGIGLWIGLLLHGAQELQKVSHNGRYLVAVGPFSLQELAKQSITGGFSVTFTFKNSWPGYLLTCFAIGVLAGCLPLGRELPEAKTSKKTFRKNIAEK